MHNYLVLYPFSLLNKKKRGYLVYIFVFMSVFCENCLCYDVYYPILFFTLCSPGLIYDLTQDYKLVFVALGVAEVLISLSYISFVIAQNYQRKKKEALTLEEANVAGHKL